MALQNMEILLEGNYHDLKIYVQPEENVDEKVFVKAHSLIISAASAPLKALIQPIPGKPKKSAIFITEFEEEVIRLAMRWIYTGILPDISKSQFLQLLGFAHVYDIKNASSNLVDLVEDRIYPLLSADNVMAVLYTTDKLKLKRREIFQNTCAYLNTWKRDMEQVKGWSTANADLLRAIYVCPTIKIRAAPTKELRIGFYRMDKKNIEKNGCQKFLSASMDTIVKFPLNSKVPALEDTIDLVFGAVIRVLNSVEDHLWFDDSKELLAFFRYFKVKADHTLWFVASDALSKDGKPGVRFNHCIGNPLQNVRANDL